jgi:hypothetical protein
VIRRNEAEKQNKESGVTLAALQGHLRLTRRAANAISSTLVMVRHSPDRALRDK